MEKFKKLVTSCVRNNVSDLHLRPGMPVAARKNGLLHFQRDITFAAEELDTLLHSLTTDRQRRILAERWSVDFSAHFPDAQMRLNAFHTADGLGLTIRFLPATIPDFEALNLHPSLRDLCSQPHGLILICGPTGNGKSTTIAAMVREINETRAGHIVTLEDPIEYRFVSERSLVDQRELGAHFPSFEQGLQDVLREDADVIVVGELRDPETMRLTINAAESGHLVIATLHAATAEEALLRLCNAFTADAQDFVRSQLASCLGAVVVQHLELLPKVGFRAPVLSIIRSAPALRNIIRENRFNQIENMQQAGRSDGMFTFERYREEFLDARTSLTPPTLVFRASSRPAPPPIRPAEPQPARPVAPVSPAPHPAAGNAGHDLDSDRPEPYRIDDEMSLEELVAQMHGKKP
ncbi:PilT/PilU family type 4a pilus ATPase [Desulfovibrio aerotolerans]|uniref:PilT/PilU family type 4a pilus ATPase n=1 Tax=Solidesulfovibrio aerotolerans TaxID=295255 RepID=A0A7C9N590_9BACT|nr:PilT/PilU family type 4a pilus ATPase [Solidesulfovibrio aerotolerans]MYL83195.1 PilT/PilU family type 4a pilus ATPase [Solidesulfovibrio aerotolerans]